MKKLIKNEICGSVNSARMHCSLKKVNICGYCSLNSSRTPQKRVKTKKTKKKKKRTKRKRGLRKRESKQRLSMPPTLPRGQSREVLGSKANK